MASAFDIHYQQVTPTEGSGEKLFSFAYASARGVRGFQKTINQWVKCLLTKRGTDLTDADYGTDFGDLFAANTFSEQDISERILLAVDDATAQTLANQMVQPVSELSADERLASAYVAEVTQVTPTEYTVYVVLRSVRNQSVKYALPTF